jgi:hypothetical protein
MAFSQSNTAYYHQPDIPGLIEKVSGQQSLVVYAGAGVSVDRTGLSWEGLVNRLLKSYMEEHEPDDQGETCTAIMTANTTLQAASIVSQKYARQAGEEEYRGEIIRQLRRLLYVTRLWQRGELITALVRLGGTFFAKGRNFSIVTTNYDEFIQREAASLTQAGSTRLDLVTSVVAHSVHVSEFDVSEHTKPYQVVHLHGYIPNAVDDGTQDIVLSELDYIRAQRFSTFAL